MLDVEGQVSVINAADNDITSEVLDRPFSKREDSLTEYGKKVDTKFLDMAAAIFSSNLDDLILEQEENALKFKEERTKWDVDLKFKDGYLKKNTNGVYSTASTIEGQRVNEVLSLSIKNMEKKLPPTVLQRKQRLKKWKKMKQNTTGKNWYDLKAPNLTPQLKQNLRLLNLRNYIFKDAHFKAPDDKKNLPKYFETGTVIEGPTEFYSARVPKSERAKSFVDELMHDSELKKYTKRKFLDLNHEKRTKFGPRKKSKRKKYR